MRLYKRILRILSLTLVILALISGTVLAAYSYYAPIQVQETDGNSYSYLPIIVTVDNNYLVANGYMSLTGLDTRVLSGSTELNHMVASDRTIFILPTLNEYSADNFRYTLGNSLLSSMSIMTGYSGYITVGDDPTMEPGSVFEWIYDGYIDTTAGATKRLIYKESAAELYVSGAGQLTCDITGGGSVTASGISSDEHAVKVTTLEGVSALDEQIIISNSVGYLGTPYDITYFPISAYGGGDDTIEIMHHVMPTAGVFSDLYIALGAAPGTGDSWAIDFMKNGAPTSLGCVISESATTGYDLTDTVTVAAGDLVCIRTDGTGTPTSTKMMHSLRFDPTTGNERILGSNFDDLNANITEYWAVVRGGASTHETTVSSYFRDPFPTTGTIKNLYVDLNTAPGVGTSYTFTVMHWDASLSSEIATDIEVIVAGNDTTGNDTTDTVDIDIGDSVYIRAVPSDVDPAVDTWTAGLVFEVDTVGETPIFGFCADDNPGDGDLNVPYAGTTDTWTSGTPFFRSQLAQDCIAKKLYVRITQAPGAGTTSKYSLQRNGSDLLSVLISDTDTSGSNLVDTMQLKPWDYLEMQYEDEVGVPANANDGWWSFVLLAQGAGMRMYVDDILEDTDTVIPNVPDNDNDWIIASGNSTPYLSSLTMEAYDIETLDFQEITSLLMSTTVDDQSINGNDGTITWGSNPVGVDVILGSLVSSGQPIIPPAGDGTIIDIVPEGQVPAGGIVDTSELQGNPLYPVVKVVHDYTGYSEEQIWFAGATLIILMGMGIAAVKVPNHLLLAGTVGLVLAGFFTAMEIYQWWMMLIFGFVFIMSILMERKPVL